MLTRLRNWRLERALERADETCMAIAEAITAAVLAHDRAAQRYYEAEYTLANNRRRALLGNPNPGRYCCDQKCERQGRENCACQLLPAPPTVPDAPWYLKLRRHTVLRALLITCAVLWGGFFFFLTT